MVKITNVHLITKKLQQYDVHILYFDLLQFSRQEWYACNSLNFQIISKAEDSPIVVFFG